MNDSYFADSIAETEEPEQEESKPQPPKKSCFNPKLLFAVLILIVAYSALGLKPVVARHLQTVEKIPSLSLNGICNGISFCLLTPFVFIFNVIRYCWYKRKEKHKDYNPNKSFASLLIKKFKFDSMGQLVKTLLVTILVGFIFVTITYIKSVSALLAARFTPAINVQLITLLSPLCVTLFSMVIVTFTYIYNKCSNPKAMHLFLLPLNIPMFICIVIAMIGGVLIILGTESIPDDNTFTFVLDWNLIGERQTGNVVGGILLAANYNLFYSFHVLYVNFITTSASSALLASVLKYSRFKFNPINLMYMMAGILSLISMSLSGISGEDWSQWSRLSNSAWSYVIVYIVVCYSLADTCIYLGISLAGGVVASTLMTISLISAIVFSWIILDERIANLWQIFGILLVITSILCFVFCKARLTQHNKKKEDKHQARLREKQREEEMPDVPIKEGGV